MRANTGQMPSRLAGKRVVVKLRCGVVAGREPVGNALPAGWAVNTSRWTLTGSPWDIVEYEVAR